MVRRNTSVLSGITQRVGIQRKTLLFSAIVTIVLPFCIILSSGLVKVVKRLEPDIHTIPQTKGFCHKHGPRYMRDAVSEKNPYSNLRTRIKLYLYLSNLGVN